MLVLSRKKGESIVIGDEVELVVLSVRGDRVKLGFNGPKEIPIHRKELHDEINSPIRSLQHAECV